MSEHCEPESDISVEVYESPIPFVVRGADIEKALDVAYRYGQTEGGHHRVWVIDQMVRVLVGQGYAAWVSAYQAEYGCEWDTGIAP